MKTLPRSFYTKPTLNVAKELLGKVLHYKVRGTDNRGAGAPKNRNSEISLQGRIIETEAYLKNDKACHASRGMTPRNAPMFGKPGVSYVYFTYGMHYCFNVVTQPEGIAEAVLIRAVEPMNGIEIMKKNRKLENLKTENLTNGPAKLCQAFGIDKKLNQVDLTKGDFVIKKDGFKPKSIQKAIRIGIKLDADKLWRFYY